MVLVLEDVLVGRLHINIPEPGLLNREREGRREEGRGRLAQGGLFFALRAVTQRAWSMSISEKMASNCSKLCPKTPLLRRQLNSSKRYLDFESLKHKHTFSHRLLLSNQQGTAEPMRPQRPSLAEPLMLGTSAGASSPALAGELSRCSVCSRCCRAPSCPASRP